MAKPESLKLESEGSNPSSPAIKIKERYMSKLGYIYLITNKKNGMQYVGQTSRDIPTRFNEHCYDDRSRSKIHLAIKIEGVSNFTISELERVPLEQLDERERYWIKTLNTRTAGYNVAEGGQSTARNYKQVQIVENGFIIDSKEDLAREISKLTSWGISSIKTQLTKVIDTDQTFCNYHIKSCIAGLEELTDIVDLENWIKTLNVRFQGKHLYCEELDMEFETTGEAARWLIDNNYYQGISKMPIQSLVTALGKHLHGDTEQLDCVGGFHFYYLPGTTKNKGGSQVGVAMKVFCPELNMTFDSQVNAARYMVDNKIWKVTLKTAKLRISDVIRGVFPDYKGYTFTKVEENCYEQTQT